MPVAIMTFAMFCRCRSVMKPWSPNTERSGIDNVSTMAKPE